MGMTGYYKNPVSGQVLEIAGQRANGDYYYEFWCNLETALASLGDNTREKTAASMSALLSYIKSNKYEKVELGISEDLLWE